jgi:hypothetical protein
LRSVIIYSAILLRKIVTEEKNLKISDHPGENQKSEVESLFYSPVKKRKIMRRVNFFLRARNVESIFE